MGKRGGRNRNKKSAAALKLNCVKKEADEEPSSKRPKVVEAVVGTTEENDAKKKTPKNRLEVICVGNDDSGNENDIDSSSIPQALGEDLETNEENGSASTNNTNSSLEPLRKIWKYLAANQNKNTETQTNNWKPTLIQRQLWPILLDERAVKHKHTIGIAPTGSGKTLAYAIPTLINNPQSTSILVLVPTRELVHQVAKVYTRVVKASGYNSQPEQESSVRVVPIHGGVNRQEQKDQLLLNNSTTNKKDNSQRSFMIVVATPGRLLDLLGDEDLKFPKLGSMVLDEADQLAKDGDLGPQVDQIFQKVLQPEQATRLTLVSATYPEKVQQKFQEWVGANHVTVKVDHMEQSTSHKNPKRDDTEAAEDGSPSENVATSSFARIPSHIEQILHVCSDHKKPKKLLHTIRAIRQKEKGSRSASLGIVFFSKVERANYVSKLLTKEGIPNVELHGKLSMDRRKENLHTFSVGKRPLLLATDLASRGIDIPAIRFVIQYDFPSNLQQYIHRCGRAGRNGEPATVYSFFTRGLKLLAPDMVQLLEANNAWVDNNLRALIGGSSRPPKQSGANNRKPKADKAAPKEFVDRFDEEIDDFAELAANRIVLKRAGHVSDASSSEESDNDNSES